MTLASLVWERQCSGHGVDSFGDRFVVHLYLFEVYMSMTAPLVGDAQVAGWVMVRNGSEGACILQACALLYSIDIVDRFNRLRRVHPLAFCLFCHAVQDIGDGG